MNLRDLFGATDLKAQRTGQDRWNVFLLEPSPSTLAGDLLRFPDHKPHTKEPTYPSRPLPASRSSHGG